jgi:ABC-type transport system involved in multi-copper enzyme maturation permease subunit
LLSGPFLTADCLSEERRDGTLSLLFLAGLRARNIVLGKFIGISLTAIFGLLALLPITAIPILLGGVGLQEFGRMALALLNTLFFSLAIGLGVSAVVTSYSRGVAGTLALLAIMGAGLPALAQLGSMMGWPPASLCVTWVSPFFPFWCARDAAYAPAPHTFWITLLASHFMGWVCLAFGSSHVSRSWQNIDLGRKRSTSGLWPRRTRSQSRPRRALRGDAFDPVVRLIGDESLLRCVVWLLVIAWGGLLWVDRFWFGQTMPIVSAACVGAFVLKVLVAFQACRFFIEARRSGALELLLCTPLRNADLISAQWRAMLRIFLWPLIVFLLLAWIAMAVPSIRGAMVSLGPTPREVPGLRTGCLGAIFLTVRMGADILAVGWFGMWLALTVRKPGLAPALTILAVLILPTMLMDFDLVADMFFISWGTTRLQEDFRRLADTTLAPSASAAKTEQASLATATLTSPLPDA